jgi:drug/metabolite transporter (DMT)-like permease
VTISGRGTRVDWLLFLALSFMWGSSYLFIKIGVNAGLTPLTLVTLRLVFGVLLIAAVVIAARERLPRGLKEYGKLSVLGFFGIALPFALITWAERSVDSSVAAVLNAPTPLFVVIFAAMLLPDERLTVGKILGVIVGLAGVAVLVGFDPTNLGGGELIGELALLVACMSYGIAGVYARRFITGYRPMIPALFEVGTALVMIGVLAFIFENPIGQIATIQLDALFSVIWLGVLGSGLAFLVFFRLLGNWGATRTSLVTYVAPVWGIALGALVLSEVIDVSRLAGTALVIAGITLVNLNRGTIASAAASVRGRFGANPPAAEPVAGPR